MVALDLVQTQGVSYFRSRQRSRKVLLVGEDQQGGTG